MKKVIDISQWQTNVKYSNIPSDIDGAIIRIGYRGYGSAGTLCKDIQFDNHIKGIKSINKPYGFYFLSQAKNKAEAIAEANYAHSIIKDYSPTYPVYIDIEESSEENHRGRADSNTVAAWTEVAVAFCERIKELGYIPGVYASEYWFNNKLNFSKIKNYSIWCAKYGADDGEPHAKPTISPYDGWQYTSKNKVSGFPDRIDTSYFYKDFAAPPKPKEEVKPKEEKVSYTAYYVNCKDGLNYRSTPNGNLKGTLAFKTKVEVVNKSETEKDGLTWVKIKNGNYVAKKYLSSKPIVDTYSTLYVNCEDGLNYRATPNGTWNGLLKNGTKVEVINGTEKDKDGLTWVQLKNKSWVAKKFLSETKPTVKLPYEVGKNYKLVYNMKVRVAPSLNAKQKLYKDLTPDGQRHAIPQLQGVLKAGTVITVLEVIEDKTEIWIKCPSGYICGRSGKVVYIK